MRSFGTIVQLLPQGGYVGGVVCCGGLGASKVEPSASTAIVLWGCPTLPEMAERHPQTWARVKIPGATVFAVGHDNCDAC